MNLRNEAHARFRKSKLESHKIYYKELKGVVNSALHSEKKAYFKQHINCNINNPRLLWKNLKQNVLPSYDKDPNLPVQFNDPDLINDHFLQLPGKNEVNISDLTYYEFQRYNSSTFKIKPVSETAVSKIINGLKSNAVGADDISLQMIIWTLPQTLNIITAIINASIESGTFPDAWKVAIIKPIPKTNNPADVKDLRPISILPCLSKVLERVVCSQMIQYLETNNVLPSAQSGFRKQRSTSTALLDVVDNVLAAQDAGEGTILTLLDFSRAFDTINTSLMLSKLSYYGFESGTVQWFASYLSLRSQKVELRGENGSSLTSKLKLVTRGVPQGSILGPILFILYSADIANQLQNCKYHIYADDIQVYISCKPEETVGAINKLNEDLDRIAAWSNTNTLALNPVKSKFLIMGTVKQIDKILNQDPQVEILGQRVERVTEARNLGVQMDGEMRFEAHILDTVRNCFYRLKVLYRVRDFLTVDLRVRLCEALVLSKLNYADVVYGPRLRARTARLVQRVQNACARFCFNVPPRAHVTPFIDEANMLKMGPRRELHLASLLFGIVKYQQPSYLYEKLKWLRDCTQLESRSASYKLVLPPYKTVAFRGSFRYSATKCWNNLPPPIRNQKTVHSFKSKLKIYLLELQKSNSPFFLLRDVFNT